MESKLREIEISLIYRNRKKRERKRERKKRKQIELGRRAALGADRGDRLQPPWRGNEHGEHRRRLATGVQTR